LTHHLADTIRIVGALAQGAEQIGLVVGLLQPRRAKRPASCSTQPACSRGKPAA